MRCRSDSADSAADNVPPAALPAVRLRALPVDEAVALLGGYGAPGTGLGWHEDYPMPETLSALAMVMGAHQAAGTMGAGEPLWWLHQIVLERLVVGDAGFHGPPGDTSPVEVEIGYNVVDGLRGRGIATRACRLLAQRAWRDGASVVRAETEADNPDNVASQQVLRRAGFRDEGGGRFVLPRPKLAT